MAPKKLTDIKHAESSSDQSSASIHGRTTDGAVSNIRPGGVSNASLKKKQPAAARSIVVRVVQVHPPKLVYADLASFKDIVQKFTGNSHTEDGSDLLEKQNSWKAESRNEKSGDSAETEMNGSEAKLSEARCMLSTDSSTSSSSCCSGSSGNTAAMSYDQICSHDLDGFVYPWENSDATKHEDAEQAAISSFGLSDHLSFLDALPPFYGISCMHDDQQFQQQGPHGPILSAASSSFDLQFT